jgi:hypothetical protein
MGKLNIKTIEIKEQIINDETTGLMLIFSASPTGQESRLQLIGECLPFGNRDYQFNRKGELVGTGTGLDGCECKDD